MTTTIAEYLSSMPWSTHVIQFELYGVSRLRMDATLGMLHIDLNRKLFRNW